MVDPVRTWPIGEKPVSVRRTEKGRHADRSSIFVSLLRLRYQLLFGLLLTSVVPLLLRSQGDLAQIWASPSGRNTLLGTAFAVVGGVLILRQINRFPGVNDTYYVLPSFVASYAVVLIGFFLFRLDYSRFQFVVSFAIACVWYFVAFLVARRHELLRLAVLPGIELRDRGRVERVHWLKLEAPQIPQRQIHGVIADLRVDLSDDWERFIADCALRGIPVFHVKQAMESLTGRVEIEHLSENTLGTLIPNRVYLHMKDLIDWLVAFLLLPILLPFLFVVGLLIRLESKGPAIFRQTRTGYRGQPFTVYKLRTMISAEEAAEKAREAAITRDNDPRITRLGRFLRRTRIDELPQIFNILRGEMSWIGPRPEAKVLSDWFEGALPFYRYRYVVRPGITGWAQINQGHVATDHEVLEKLHYDFFYIKHFSLWLDVLVLFRTIGTVLTGRGAK
ncbi:sugar transferase [Amorphus sp. 3PC139-8]|uniref:sugar transferase n=1 Tax=Amorphus sp. 3PC139-8 TaxID=2735676 RepID=UPI00345C6C9B